MDAVTGAIVIAGLKYVGPEAAKVVSDFMGKVLAPPGEALGEVLARPIVDWQKRKTELATRLVTDAARKVEAAGQVPMLFPPGF